MIFTIMVVKLFCGGKRSNILQNILMTKFLVFIVILFWGLNCDFLDEEKEITQSIYFFPSGLDPAKDTKYFEYQIFSQIYEPLVKLDHDFTTLLPCLAESWEISDDNLSYTFKLKSDIPFHDGSSLSADVVKYSYLRQIGIRTEDPLSKIIDKINVVDSLTLEICLKHPFKPFLYSLASPTAGLMVISRQAIEKYGDKISKNPVGTGPYYLEEWQENDKISLKSFNRYRTKHNFSKITFSMPDSLIQPEVQFKNGELDILYMVAGNWLDRLKWLGQMEYYVQKSTSTLFIGFNIKSKPVDDIRVRRAILKSLDIKRSVILANRGNAIPASNPLPPIYSGFEDLIQENFDPKEAKILLEMAGHSDEMNLNFHFLSRTFSRPMKVELIKSQLEKVGIKLNIILFSDPIKYSESIYNEDCHMFLDGYGAELIGDPGIFLYSIFHSSSKKNILHYNNKKVDKLINEALRTSNDEERHNAYRNIIRLILNDIPAIFDSHVKSHFAYNSKKIKKLMVNPYEFIYFHQLESYE